MSDNTKKFILLILFIIVSIGLAFLIYYVFFAPKKQVSVIEQPGQTQTGEFPSSGEGPSQTNEIEGGITPSGGEVGQGSEIGQAESTQEFQTNAKEIVSKNILKIKTYSDVNNGMVYYDDLNQNFYKVSQDGNIIKLSDRKFYAVKDATFSPTENRAIIEYPDNRKVLYDFDKDEFIARFPEQTQDFSFSNAGDKLSYKWIDYYEENNYLVTSNPDASNFKFIRQIADQSKNIDTVWSPDGEVMATFRKQYDVERQEIYFLNENDKNLRSLLVDGFNFSGMWNSKGDKLFYNVTEARKDFKPVLWVANGQADGLGYGKMSLGISTWVDKCSFSKSNDSTVYCAVPDELPTGSGLNAALANGVAYSIYKININTGTSEVVAQPIVNNNRVSIDKIYTSANDSSLYYTDSSNGYLYSIDLK